MTISPDWTSDKPYTLAIPSVMLCTNPTSSAGMDSSKLALFENCILERNAVHPLLEINVLKKKAEYVPDLGKIDIDKTTPEYVITECVIYRMNSMVERRGGVSEVRDSR